jgi:hypothetical protein
VPCDGVAFRELDAVQHQVIAQVARERALKRAASA